MQYIITKVYQATRWVLGECNVFCDFYGPCEMRSLSSFIMYVYDTEWQLLNYEQDPPTHNKPNASNSCSIYGLKRDSVVEYLHYSLHIWLMAFI